MTIFEAEVGSRQFNFSVEDSDQDIRRVIFPNESYFLPHARGFVMGYDPVKNISSITNTDIADIFEEPLPEFCQKVLEGHVYATQALYIPENRLIYSSSEWSSMQASLISVITGDVQARYIQNCQMELSRLKKQIPGIPAKKVVLGVKNARFVSVLFGTDFEDLNTADLLDLRNSENTESLLLAIDAEVVNLRNRLKSISTQSMHQDSLYPIKSLLKTWITERYPAITFP